LPVSDEPFLLTSNCRNTSQIHELGYRFYHGDFVDVPEIEGPKVEFISVEGLHEQAEAVARKVRELVVNQKVSPEDVVVLVTKRRKEQCYDLIRSHKLTGTVGWALEEHGKSRFVSIDTVKRFKGMEAHAVILWLGDEFQDENSPETIYVGCTRAKSALTVVGSIRALKVLHEV
jgi:superfamily I DNA/RNA helicase